MISVKRMQIPCLDDQHPDLRADFVMANPPFNIKDWWTEALAGDARWKYGTPPAGNANFGWMQHMLHHLSSNGSMALLLANGSMSSQTSNEGKTLFIDARNLGYMKDRVLRDFTREDIKKIVETYHKWQRTINEYKDEKGFCYSANIEEIRKNDYILTPGRYVSAADKEEDGEPFNEKMKRLTAQLSEQFKESARLEAEIKKNLLGIGYEV